MRAFLRHFTQPAAKLSHRVVEHIGDYPNLVAPVVTNRAREIALTIAGGDRCDRRDPAGHQVRGDPGHGDRRREPGRQSRKRPGPDRGDARLDVGERQGDADKRDAAAAHGDRRVLGGDARRRAGAAADALAGRLRLPHFFARRVILESAEGFTRHLGIAADVTVGRDERDPRVNEPAQGVGLGIRVRNVVAPGEQRSG